MIEEDGPTGSETGLVVGRRWGGEGGGGGAQNVDRQGRSNSWSCRGDRCLMNCCSCKRGGEGGGQGTDGSHHKQLLVTDEVRLP